MQSKQSLSQNCWLTVHVHSECCLNVWEWGAVGVLSSHPYIATVLAAAKLQWSGSSACRPSTRKKTCLQYRPVAQKVI